MNLFDILGKEQPLVSKIVNHDNGPGRGKKKCNCGLYLAVRTKICKNCRWEFSLNKKRELPELVIIPPVYVYEHIRTDTWEKDQAERILAKKDILAEKQNEFYHAPIEIRPLCYTIEEVLNRRGLPYNTGLTLKDDLNRLIIKCIKTDRLFKDENHPKVGLLQQLVVVEVIEV